jgi:hypothetical protein
MKLQHPVFVNGVTYSVITPRLRGSPKEWSIVDDKAGLLPKLVRIASILCDVPEAVLLELDGDDFTKLMHEVAAIAEKFAETQK